MNLISCTKFWLLLLLAIPLTGQAQQMLDKPVTISVKGQPVSGVLKQISTQGNFYFSYNSDLIPGDSLVSVNATQKPVRELLTQLFSDKFQYKEKGDYVIILPNNRDRTVHLSGFIFDTEDQKPVDFASVYSRQLLVSALSEDNGHFRLRVRERGFPVQMVISKVGYADTTIVIRNAPKEELRIFINQKPVDLDPLIVRYSEGQSTWLGRLFLSAKTRMRGRNISRFFTSLPYQASLTPGLGTHGKLSPQVINKVSLNILGGYTAGVNGVELAGGFNISRQDVRYAQVAGIFNVVSGKVSGIQLAGLHNQVLDSLRGVQGAGLGNIAKKYAGGVQLAGGFNVVNGQGSGVQAAGAFNQASTDFKGVQVSGGANLVKGSISGMQIAGGVNVAGTMKGMQLGTVNTAKNMRGFQLGVVNIADSSSGISFGLINIIKKSTSNISVFATEVAPMNLAWKMGTHKFYSILTGGIDTGNPKRTYFFGAGFGKEFFPFRIFGFTTEIINLNIYQGDIENNPFLNRFQAALTWKPARRLVVFAGPAFSVYYHNSREIKSEYQQFPPANLPISKTENNFKYWLGWQGGISWRYGKL